MRMIIICFFTAIIGFQISPYTASAQIERNQSTTVLQKKLFHLQDQYGKEMARYTNFLKQTNNAPATNNRNRAYVKTQSPKGQFTPQQQAMRHRLNDLKRQIAITQQQLNTDQTSVFK